MKAISQTLLSEQIQLNRKPAVKLEVQEFGFPAESDKIRYGDFDWHYVHHNDSTTGAMACCTKDGTLLMSNPTLAETSSPVVRWASPDYDTDFSTWATANSATDGGDIPGVYYPTDAYCMVSNPAADETYIFKAVHDYIGTYWNGAVSVYTNAYVKYRVSTNDGQTWSPWQSILGDAFQLVILGTTYYRNFSADPLGGGAYTNIPMYQGHCQYPSYVYYYEGGDYEQYLGVPRNWLKAAYNDSGDLCVAYIDRYFWNGPCACIMTRRSGSWITPYPDMYGNTYWLKPVDDSSRWLTYRARRFTLDVLVGNTNNANQMACGGHSGWTYQPGLTSINNIDIQYDDDDWWITYDYIQTNYEMVSSVDSQRVDPEKAEISAVLFGSVGDGGVYGKNTVFPWISEVDFANTELNAGSPYLPVFPCGRAPP